MIPFRDCLTRYLSSAQLATIERTRIGIAGAGGLGSNIALSLIRSGFIHFEIIDHDHIEASNLNRQQYLLSDIGKSKAPCLKEKLLAINPDAHIAAHEVRLTPENTTSHFQNVDILFEAFDRAESKKMLIEAYSTTKAIIIAGNGLAGLHMTPLPIRKVHSRLYIVGDGVSGIGIDQPPLAPKVMVCAATMAGIALELTCQK